MSRRWSRCLRALGLAAAMAITVLASPFAQVDSTSGNSLTIQVNGSEKMRVDSDGNVAIGHTGTAGISLLVSDATNTDIGLRVVGAKSGTTLAQFLRGDGGSAMLGVNIGAAGNYLSVGFSPTAVAWALGTTNTGGAFYVGSGGTTGFTLSATPLLINSSGKVSIGHLSSTTPLANLDVSGTVSATNAIQVGASTLGCSAGINGAIRYNSVSGTLQVCVGTTWAGLVSTTTGSALDGLGSANHAAFWSDANTLTYDANQFVWDASNNRMGLAVTTPSRTLHVGGDAQVANLYLTAAAGNGIGFWNGAPTSYGMFMSNNASYRFADVTDYYIANVMSSGSNNRGFVWSHGASPAMALNTALGNLTMKGTLTVSGTGDSVIAGNLGIGTNSPGYTLDVSGSQRVTLKGGSSVIELGSGQTSNQYAYIDFVGDTTYTDYGMRLIRHNSGANATGQLSVRGTGGLYLTAADAAPLVLQTSSTNRMYIGSTGNVGIGTTSPKADFDVNGTISASNVIQVSGSSLACAASINGGLRYNPTSNTLQVCLGTIWTSLSSNTTGGAGTLTGTGSATAVAYWSGASGLTYDDGFYYNATANALGIGTNAPGYALQVSGSGTTTGIGIGTASYGDAAIELGAGALASHYAYIDLVGDTTYTDYGLRILRGNGGANAGSQIIHRGTGELAIGTSEAGNVRIFTGGSNRVLVSSTGLSIGSDNMDYGIPWRLVARQDQNAATWMGIINGTVGASAATQFYMIGGTGNSYYGVSLADNNGAPYARNYGGSAVSGIFYDFNQHVFRSAAGSEYARINGTGLGIGKTPIAKLDVAGTISASDAIQVSGSSLTCASSIVGAIRYNSTSNTLQVCLGTIWTSLASGTTSALATDVPSFLVHKNGTNQTGLTSGTGAKATWSTEVFDTNNNFASDRFTPTVAGKYLVIFSAYCDNATVYCQAMIYKNGAAIATKWEYGTTQIIGVVTTIVDMNGSGDYLEAYVTTGGGTRIDGTAKHTYFTGSLLASGNGTTGGGASNIPALTDVSASSPADKQVLQYNSSISKWEATSSLVPTGAVMAFDLTSCPAGWSEYTAARGRFLRGIDNGAGNDPAGTRAPGNTQADLVGPHTHTFNAYTGGVPRTILINIAGGSSHSQADQTTAANSGVETRPKNVAVLFCRKD